MDGAAEGESSTTGLRKAQGGTEHRIEGASDGADDLGGGAVFSEDNYATGDADPGGGAHTGGSRGDLPDRAPVPGLDAGGAAGGTAEDLAGECAATGVSPAGFAVQSGVRRRSQCGAWLDGAEPPLLGTGALAGESGGDTGRLAGGDGAKSGTDCGIDARRSGRMFSRGVAEGRRNGDGSALLSLVAGAALPRGRRG